MNRSDEKLTAALRGLAAKSRQSASPEVAVALKDAFHRHHAHRRRIQRVRIAVCVICLAALAALPLLRKSPAVNNGHPVAVRSIPPAETISPAPVDASSNRLPGAAKRTLANRTARAEQSGFVRLPAFDTLPAGDQLRVVRLEMRGEELRLVGAPVTEEIARSRVTADFVVGHDGTPYAVRLVQTNF